MARKAAEAEGKLPWLPLVVADYLRDTQHLSLETQGAWMRMLCWMHTSQTRGRVVFDRRKLARSLGVLDDRVTVILSELRDSANPTGNPTCDYEDLGEGSFALTSRRMVRDEKIRQRNRVNGMRGGPDSWKTRPVNQLGNPEENPKGNPPVNPRVKSQSQREKTGEVSPDPSCGVASQTPPAAKPRTATVRSFAQSVDDYAPDISVPPSKAVPPPRGRTLGPEQGRIREQFTDWWTLEAWPLHAGNGREYPFGAEGKRNGAAVMKLLTAVKWDLEQAKAVAMAYLQADDAFISRQGRPLFVMTNQITAWLNAANNPRNRAAYAKRKPSAAERGEYVQPDRDIPLIGAGPAEPGGRAKAG